MYVFLSVKRYYGIVLESPPVILYWNRHLAFVGCLEPPLGLQ